ncbi:hypothetical protein PAPYR_6567 [Paratrimastix pyriformis]|uniref:Uncharacterized protein n=1 Tax=Paratrimastix pyriformis TaxID=342808 RepID=A0ABQ8UF55_9EUKA|nr:hypothetical protein PAPYR_6567 [Paratrimastix pyriformis]
MPLPFKFPPFDREILAKCSITPEDEDKLSVSEWAALLHHSIWKAEHDYTHNSFSSSYNQAVVKHADNLIARGLIESGSCLRFSHFSRVLPHQLPLLEICLTFLSIIDDSDGGADQTCKRIVSPKRLEDWLKLYDLQLADHVQLFEFLDLYEITQKRPEYGTLPSVAPSTTAVSTAPDIYRLPTYEVLKTGEEQLLDTLDQQYERAVSAEPSEGGRAGGPPSTGGMKRTASRDVLQALLVDRERITDGLRESSRKVRHAVGYSTITDGLRESSRKTLGARYGLLSPAVTLAPTAHPPIVHRAPSPPSHKHSPEALAQLLGFPKTPGVAGSTPRGGISARLYTPRSAKPANFHPRPKRHIDRWVCADPNATYGMPRSAAEIINEQEHALRPHPKLIQDGILVDEDPPSMPEFLGEPTLAFSFSGRLYQPSADEPSSEPICVVPKHHLPQENWAPPAPRASEIFREGALKTIAASSFTRPEEPHHRRKRRRPTVTNARRRTELLMRSADLERNGEGDPATGWGIKGAASGMDQSKLVARLAGAESAIAISVGEKIPPHVQKMIQEQETRVQVELTQARLDDERRQHMRDEQRRLQKLRTEQKQLVEAASGPVGANLPPRATGPRHSMLAATSMPPTVIRDPTPRELRSLLASPAPGGGAAGGESKEPADERPLSRGTAQALVQALAEQNLSTEGLVVAPAAAGTSSGALREPTEAELLAAIKKKYDRSWVPDSLRSSASATPRPRSTPARLAPSGGSPGVTRPPTPLPAGLKQFQNLLREHELFCLKQNKIFRVRAQSRAVHVLQAGVDFLLFLSFSRCVWPFGNAEQFMSSKQEWFLRTSADTASLATQFGLSLARPGSAPVPASAFTPSGPSPSPASSTLSSAAGLQQRRAAVPRLALGGATEQQTRSPALQQPPSAAEAAEAEQPSATHRMSEEELWELNEANLRDSQQPALLTARHSCELYRQWTARQTARRQKLEEQKHSAKQFPAPETSRPSPCNVHQIGSMAQLAERSAVNREATAARRAEERAQLDLERELDLGLLRQRVTVIHEEQQRAEEDRLAAEKTRALAARTPGGAAGASTSRTATDLLALPMSAVLLSASAQRTLPFLGDPVRPFTATTPVPASGRSTSPPHVFLTSARTTAAIALTPVPSTTAGTPQAESAAKTEFSLPPLTLRLSLIATVRSLLHSPVAATPSPAFSAPGAAAATPRTAAASPRPAVAVPSPLLTRSTQRPSVSRMDPLDTFMARVSLTPVSATAAGMAAAAQAAGTHTPRHASPLRRSLSPRHATRVATTTSMTHAVRSVSSPSAALVGGWGGMGMGPPGAREAPSKSEA